MTTPTSPAPLAGGSLLALAIVIGGVIGTLDGQSTLGILLGGAIGLALMGLVWAIDRRRTR